MAKFTLKQLRYFEALALHGHFGRASEVSSISQPALSMQIRELENAVEMPLFERSARTIRLTPFGEEFSKRAQEILRSVDELSDLARSAKTALTGRLRIGVIPTIAPYLLPEIISRLTNQFPGIDIHVRETLTQKLVGDLRQGLLDTAIVALPISEPFFTEVALFKEEFLLVRPSNDEGKPLPNSESLAKMKLLLLEEGHCFRDQALSFCNIRPGLPKEGLDGSSLSTLVQMVSAGIGVTLIPEMARSIETRSANVSVTRFSKPAPSRTIGIIWRKTNPMSDQFLQVAEVVKQVAVTKKPD